MFKNIRLFILLIIIANIVSLLIVSTITNHLHAQQQSESSRFMMIQGRRDHSQAFIIDTYSGNFWHIDYWGIPNEKPRISGPYRIQEK